MVRFLSLWVLATVAVAQELPSPDTRYIADIELQNSDQFVELLQRASQLLVDGLVAQEDVPTVTFVLHGPVIRDLLRENYGSSRQAVDLAASLTALQVVDIKVCETWLGKHGLDARQLQPFVETVSFAPGELRRLKREKNYVDF